MTTGYDPTVAAYIGHAAATTTTESDTQVVTRVRVADLIPGDVISYVNGGYWETGEVRHVELRDGTRHPDPEYLVVFRGGGHAALSGHVDRLTEAAAEQWRTDHERARHRAELADMLDRLAALVRNGSLPLPEYDRLYLHYFLGSVADLEQAAAAYDQVIDYTGTSRFLRVDVTHGRHEIEFSASRPAPTADVAEAAAEVPAELAANKAPAVTP